MEATTNAKTKLQNWDLTDAIAMSAACPNTFFSPCPALINLLRIGDSVQLGFDVDPIDRGCHFCIGERMWVRVTSITPHGLIGTLRNYPMAINALEYGQVVQFQARNILDLNLRPEEKLNVMDVHGLFDDDGVRECRGVHQ
jgi:uncharacterized protein YegJ (DUF2314 family)